MHPTVFLSAGCWSDDKGQESSFVQIVGRGDVTQLILSSASTSFRAAAALGVAIGTETCWSTYGDVKRDKGVVRSCIDLSVDRVSCSERDRLVEGGRCSFFVFLFPPQSLVWESE